jgi:DNA-binding CsgD family transcriptional regulator
VSAVRELPPRTFRERPRGLQRVSKRILECHKLRSSGMTREQVAAAMGITVRTVSTLTSRYKDAVEDGLIEETANTTTPMKSAS